MTTMTPNPQKTVPFAVPKRDRRAVPRLDWQALTPDARAHTVAPDRQALTDSAKVRRTETQES